jgi:predicted MFS family arabinose efflux permease
MPSLWPAFGLGLAVAVGNGLARFAYALLLPAMREDLGWSYAQAGWLNTANALGYVLGAASGYALLARTTPARLFSLGLVLTVVSLPATGAWPNLAWLTAARLLSGIGPAWVFACGSALIAARYQHDVRRRGAATGLFFSGAGLGIALSGMSVYPLLAWLGAAGWPQVWLLLGLLALALSVWPWREARQAVGGEQAPSHQPLSLPGLWLPLLAYFAFAAGYIVYMTFILAWMRGQGWPWPSGLLVWVTLGLGVALSPFVWRRALEHWPPAWTLAASCAATAAGTAIPLFDVGAAGLVGSAALFGLGVFIAPSSVAVLVRQRMPAALWAKGMTLFTVVFALGQSIGPVAAGWIADSATLGRSLLFGLVLLLVGAALPLLRPSFEWSFKRQPGTGPKGET